MVSFPFLHLPQVTQDLIIRNFTPYEIFHFSLISKKSHQLAKHAKILVNTFTWKLTEYGESILVEAQGSQKLSKIPLCGYLKYQNGARWYPIDNVMIASNFLPDGILVSCKLEKDSEILYEVVTSRLLGIMKIGAFSCAINTSEIPPFILNITRCFKRLTVSTERPISHEHARFLLEETIVEKFTFLAPVERGFSCTKPLGCKEIFINHAEWFTGGNLLNTDCESITIFEAGVTRADALEFFEKWKTGGFPRLRSLELEWRYCNKWTLSVGQVYAQGHQIVKNCNGNTAVLKIGYRRLVFEVNPINRDV